MVINNVITEIWLFKTSGSTKRLCYTAIQRLLIAISFLSQFNDLTHNNNTMHPQILFFYYQSIVENTFAFSAQ